jgi:hypothetical protein
VSISDFSIYVAGLPLRREESAAKLNFDGMKLANTFASSANELITLEFAWASNHTKKYNCSYRAAGHDQASSARGPWQIQPAGFNTHMLRATTS